MMKLIVGLGNPGKQYADTRHNVGFMAVTAIAVERGAPQFKEEKKFKADITKTEDLIFAKPLTYMNNSGDAISSLVNFFKIAPKDLWVIYDDVDLPLGTIRIRPDGASGSHNGMKSIVSCLGTDKFPRIRIGIESRGVTAPPEQDISSFVLEKFNKEDKKMAEESVIKTVSALNMVLSEGMESAMNRFN